MEMSDQIFIDCVRCRYGNDDIKIGKLRVRLKGKALLYLRALAYDRAFGMCQECSKHMWYMPRYKGDPDAYDMAHIRSRGACGSDLPSNVQALCHRCHMKSHGMKLS